MLDIGIGSALLAGLLSFFSPCVLPIVPPYLAYLAGLSVGEISDEELNPNSAKRLFYSSVFFVLGFTTLFIALGATASIVGQLIAQHFNTLSIIAGAFILITGLHFIGVFKIGFLYREARFGMTRKPTGMFGNYVMGLAFAFGWTPCVGPVLAAILFVAGSEESVIRGATLLAAYSFGIGIPFIAAGVFAARFLKYANKFKKHLSLIEKIMGTLLVLTGLLFMTGSISYIAQILIDVFPAFMALG